MSSLHSLTIFALLLALPAQAAPPEQAPQSDAVAVADASEPAPAPAPDLSEGQPVLIAAKQPVLFENLTIVGGSDRVEEIPGSAHYLSEEELEVQDYTDIHRILRQIPGINVQEEEGFGLRPNIGMRGTGLERSQKITLLEDGVLIAPAPYSAPAAYYFPTAGRMEAVEVRKGSTSIIQGPYTTGGAINLISTSIPYGFAGAIEASAGEFGTGKAHASFGGSSERFGWLLETFQLRSDGFKDLDGGGDTGFDLQDYIGKIRVNSDASSRVQQALELKLGYVTQDGDETYLGLTDADFLAAPFRRYAASQADVIDTEHEQIQLRHLVAPSSKWDVTTTAYRNDFFRNWHKLGSIGGVGIASILENPELHADLMAIARGELDDESGSLSVRNNRRDYYSMGIQSVAAIRVDGGSDRRHEIEIGLRYHEDEEDRFQEDEKWGMRNGRMFFVSQKDPGTNANRVGSAEAIAFFVQDRISMGRLTLTPGVRYETIDFTREDFGRNDPGRTGDPSVRTNSVDAWIPGIGLVYELSPQWGLFGGVHRGFAPPGPGADQRTRPEQSINYETGVRYVASPFTSQLVAFFNDYSNLLGRDTLSSGGGGSGDLFNGGKVEVKGLEASVDSDLIRMFGGTASTLSAPLRLAFTWTEATFQSSFATGFADWKPEVSAGDRLPYIPENQWTLGAGLTGERWMGYATLNYSDEMLTRPAQGDIPDRFKTDDHLILDLSAEVQLIGNLRGTAQLRNVTDETYIVARRPAGARPGMPRTLFLGVRLDF
ncbi:MAG: TonB-dependent receptor [Acidobacteria bacterium]|nr:TonB-dependent receptor [Acidobacteriota bacterium]